MKKNIKKIGILIVSLGFPLTLFSAIWLKIVRKTGIGIIAEKLFMLVGVLPVLDHYYEPLINPKKHLIKSLREDRKLPGIDMNIDEQLSLLSKFNFVDELIKIPFSKKEINKYYYDNTSYKSGDAEYLYNIIRHFKPKRVIEIGSGFSTMMAQNAIKKNKEEDVNYKCNHICIEPYEMPWLKELDVNLVRKRVENIGVDFFRQLEKDDILFIDSSHIIRPQGDVLFEYLELIPILNSGVLVHIHDIFTPKDYLTEWVLEKHLLWNEQYLLEAFLSFNSEFRIVGALNYLAHNHKTKLEEKCPIFAKENNREPGAFWMIKS